MKEQKRINDGGSKYVILVYSHEFKKCYKADFYKWLVKDFKNVSNEGCYEACPWVYVNLLNKTYFPGIPGVKITHVLNDHAVTIAEFYSILAEFDKNREDFDKSEIVSSIYKKYKGKGPFVFNKHRFDCDEGYSTIIRKTEKIRKRTLCFLQLYGITAIESEHDYILPKESLKFYKTIVFHPKVEEIWEKQKLSLPDKGIYKVEVHQQGIPGEEYFDCNVELYKDKIRLIDVTKSVTRPDLLRDIRIFNN